MMWDYDGPDLSEAELLERLQGTPTQRDGALKCLCQQNFKKIRALVRAKGKGKIEFHEVMSAGLHGVDLTVRRGKYKGKAKLGSLLYTICKNFLTQELSRQQTMTFSSAHHLPEYPESSPHRPDFQLIAKEHTSLVQQLLDQAGEKCRELWLRTFDRAEKMEAVVKDLGITDVQQGRNQKLKCKDRVIDLVRKSPHLQQLIQEILG